ARVGCDLPIVIDGVVGTDVEDLEPAILVLRHGDLLGGAAQRALSAPGRPVGRELPIVIDGVVGTDVEDLEPAVLVLHDGTLLGPPAQGGAAAPPASERELIVVRNAAVGAEEEYRQPAVRVLRGHEPVRRGPIPVGRAEPVDVAARELWAGLNVAIV